MQSFKSGLIAGLKGFTDIIVLLRDIIFNARWFLCSLVKASRNCFRLKPRDGCRVKLPASVYKRPDPLIYDQYYLMAQGIAVTWDNPDIQLEDMNGSPVAADSLIANTDYRVAVRVWNNSYGAPAVGLPVYLSYLSFGIGITSTPISVNSINLGVKGSIHCPIVTHFIWRTPTIPGHYCLQALLVWSDDANPFNNLGQKNTQVGKAQSPAAFTIEVHNQAAVQRRFEIEADMYQLPVLAPCGDSRALSAAGGRYAGSKARWEAALRTQAYGLFPIKPTWSVVIMPRAFDLGPNASVSLSVSIEPVGGAPGGVQPFNIHGFAAAAGRERALVGGVTLYVETI
jgi:hypothetical protein